MTVWDKFVSAYKSDGPPRPGETLATRQRKWATKMMAQLHPKQFGLLCRLAEETTYVVRRYGQCTMMCWPKHELLPPIDPWQGRRMPKAVLCMEFAKALMMQVSN